MFTHIIRVLLSAVPTVIGVLTCVFLITRLVPGDPALLILGEYAPQEQVVQLRQELGLDQPIHVQYFRYLSRVVRGDLGVSLRTERSVIKEIIDVFPYTVELALVGIFISIVIGVPIGMISAKSRNTPLDYITMTFAMLGISMPVFWTGILLTLVFSLYLGWFPAIGGGDPSSLASKIMHLILPSIAVGMVASAITARMTRTSMIEVLSQDYVRTARAKGLGELRVVCKHALRNALIPVITVIGLNMGRLLGGTIVAEIVFARPGMGKLLVNAIYARDYPQVQGIVAFFAVVIILVNLLVDLAYTLIDPRIKL
jgi:peptide/nickel transport system permease protein